mmetsp:Transcript_5723/g.6715  ORF Transcript_5723/g.6715 Transcript_5723/m.6715 type:complete len:82 (+) Transcript_5723:331-576(+)
MERMSSQNINKLNISENERNLLMNCVDQNVDDQKVDVQKDLYSTNLVGQLNLHNIEEVDENKSVDYDSKIITVGNILPAEE